MKSEFSFKDIIEIKKVLKETERKEIAAIAVSGIPVIVNLLLPAGSVAHTIHVSSDVYEKIKNFRKADAGK